MPFVVPAIINLGTALITAGANALVGLGLSGASAWSIATSVVNFGFSQLINAAASALFGKKPSAQDVGRDLAQPTTAPAHRFVYGETRATGTPIGTPIKGPKIYGCWLLNSRASDLSTFTLYLDKREVGLTGDAFDLSGPGASATEHPFENHVNVWVSRGDHTAPPAVFTDEAPWVETDAEHLWKATDAWQGWTVIWLKLDAGGQGERQERWPSSPPLVEVEGRWSKVYDPREASHDPDDPDTWEWSENHALCIRDALRQNPIRQYQEDQLHESFNEYGPDVCDEIVALKSGGSEKRYICGGTLVFSDGEIEDQLNPMFVSGAADPIRIGGKLGYAAGEYRAPDMTLGYMLGQGFSFPDMVPGDEVMNTLRVSYLSPNRGYETAELEPWEIPGARDADGGLPAVKTLDLPFCASATQAMRVRKIIGLRQRRQERIQGGELPPEALNLVGGSTVNIALPAPYDVLDGVYEVESIHPGLDPLGESGEVAMRLPASLVKHDPAIYAWDAATDEEDVFDEPYDDERTGTANPGAISVTTGDAVNQSTGGTIIPRILFAFDPSTSGGVAGYDWQYRETSGDYTTGGVIDVDVRNGDGKVFGYLVGTPGQTYDIRARATGSSGQSDWVEITGVTPVVDIEIDLPTDGQAVGGAGEITASFRTPNDPDFRAMEIWGSDSDDSGAASLIGTAIYTSQNTVVSITESSLGASMTRYYFARSRGDYASASAFTASVSATTDP
ncbi:phage tail protein [Sulfitobacter sp. W002]|uniref:phage tail protein n=1 Tax=Sulfitobacter sp. W002 TaxID=2867024 RepID=UPI0021A29EBD|nr:phage tail protein [Sulfitobacter sp. W002]UWR30442.1 phage tail protein [Sulfitobacter sp. W002]